MRDAVDGFLASGLDVTWEAIPVSPGASRATVAAPRGALPHRFAKWRALPGRYERPQGMPWSETFVVYAGRGMLLHSHGLVELRPGVVINIELGMSYTLLIEETLEKLAIVTTAHVVAG